MRMSSAVYGGTTSIFGRRNKSQTLIGLGWLLVYRQLFSFRWAVQQIGGSALMASMRQGRYAGSALYERLTATRP